ncbi:hypothetical protein Bhyg_11506 [Pseudolycoriella hygida]|uniref:Uncharacterized protein n=1 Tax=Pseudolycoriella hygida TaxID=35572 RepID=A0A9Q0MVJ8_9DIPT|nr:hypothetical protein Bhyg_11506 [Pseudolycoriella hygida]
MGPRQDLDQSATVTQPHASNAALTLRVRTPDWAGQYFAFSEPIAQSYGTDYLTNEKGGFYVKTYELKHDFQVLLIKNKKFADGSIRQETKASALKKFFKSNGLGKRADNRNIAESKYIKISENLKKLYSNPNVPLISTLNNIDLAVECPHDNSNNELIIPLNLKWSDVLREISSKVFVYGLRSAAHGSYETFKDIQSRLFPDSGETIFDCNVVEFRQAIATQQRVLIRQIFANFWNSAKIMQPVECIRWYKSSNFVNSNLVFHYKSSDILKFKNRFFLFSLINVNFVSMLFSVNVNFRLKKNLQSQKGSRTGNSGNHLELQVLTLIQYKKFIKMVQGERYGPTTCSRVEKDQESKRTGFANYQKKCQTEQKQQLAPKGSSNEQKAKVDVWGSKLRNVDHFKILLISFIVQLPSFNVEVLHLSDFYFCKPAVCISLVEIKEKKLSTMYSDGIVRCALTHYIEKQMATVGKFLFDFPVFEER